MKIGLVLDDSLDKSDGVQQYVLTLGKWLRSHGHDVHYLVGHTERKDIQHVHSLSRNIQVHFNQNRLSTPLPASKQHIRDLLTKEQFDVLHIQMPYSPFLAGRIIKAAPASTAIIGTFHIIPFSNLERLGTRLLGSWLRSTLKRFDAICSVSEPAAKFAKQTFKVKTMVIPNAIDSSFFHATKPFRQYQDGLTNVVFLGRLVERKGCLYLLKALEQLHASGKLDGVRVLICGKGPLQAELENFVRKNHLGRIVRFVGFVSEADKARYLKSAHVAVFPSTGGESFGIVLIEAMAAGSDVVLAGNNIGYASVLKGRPSQLINPKDTKAFSKSLSHYIANARARKHVKQWQDEAVKQYDVKQVGEQLVSLYLTALQRKSKVR